VIGSHIIPKFYLEQFSIRSARGVNKPGRIWVYEKGKAPSQRATTVQGAENGYFGFIRPDGTLDESLETELAKRENECNDVLVCAKSDLFHWPIGSHDKLAFYCGLLYSRATQRRTFAGRNHFDMVAELRQAADEQFIAVVTEHLTKALGTSVRAAAVRTR
jgi:hypothetical protein